MEWNGMDWEGMCFLFVVLAAWLSCPCACLTFRRLFIFELTYTSLTFETFHYYITFHCIALHYNNNHTYRRLSLDPQVHHAIHLASLRKACEPDNFYHHSDSNTNTNTNTNKKNSNDNNKRKNNFPRGGLLRIMERYVRPESVAADLATIELSLSSSSSSSSLSKSGNKEGNDDQFLEKFTSLDDIAPNPAAKQW